MRLKAWVAVLTLTATATLFAADKPKAAPPAMSAEEKAAMEAMAKAGTPGPEHKKLDGMIGTWDTKVTMWMAPGAPPATSGGISTNRWIFGGRYMEQKFSGTFMGMPFSGLGYTGYDNVKKQYFGTWMDNMGTGIMISSGGMASANTWKFKGTAADPVTGKDMTVDETVTLIDKNHHTMEMYGPGPDGKNFKMMEIKYSRKK
jgi:hypothetical protein